MHSPTPRRERHRTQALRYSGQTSPQELQCTLATRKAESTTQGIGQMVSQRKTVHPRITTHLYREELVGGGPEGSPATTVYLLSGSFKNWALGKSGAGQRARPWPWQTWGWLGGLSLLLSPNWMEAATPTLQRLKMERKGPRPSLADLVAWGQSVSLIQGWQLKTQTKRCWGHSELLYAGTPYLT